MRGKVFFPGERLNHLSIYVGNNNGLSNPFDAAKYAVCAKVCRKQINRKKYYSCKGKMKGRHVALARYEAGFLTLCEVEVYTVTVQGDTIIYFVRMNSVNPDNNLVIKSRLY